MNTVKINKVPTWALYYMCYGEGDGLTENEIIEKVRGKEKYIIPIDWQYLPGTAHKPGKHYTERMWQAKKIREEYKNG